MPSECGNAIAPSMCMRLPSAGAPHGAGEIAEAVRGKQRGLFERRNEKRAGQMRLVVLDAVKFRGKFCGIDIERRGERFRNSHELGHHLGALASETRHPQWRTEAWCPGAPRDCAGWRCGDFGKRDARCVQAIADRRRGKSRRVFHAVKAFFFDGGDQAAIADDRRGGVAVIGVDSKDVHPVMK